MYKKVDLKWTKLTKSGPLLPTKFKHNWLLQEEAPEAQEPGSEEGLLGLSILGDLPAIVWPQEATPGPAQAEFWPEPGKGPDLQAGPGPKEEAACEEAKPGQGLGQVWPKLGQIWPKLSQVGQVWQKLAQVAAYAAESAPEGHDHLAAFGPSNDVNHDNDHHHHNNNNNYNQGL